MNQMQQMKSPAAGVPPQLLPHMHLVSKHRYPQSNNPSIESIVSFLLEGSKIMNEVAPVQWQMLDCPTDGTMMLMWQPPDLGANFATDGYIYSDHEQTFNSDVRGYSLQMYIQRSGFRPGVEQVATHSRRRYRLIPTQQNMGGPMPDPSIWLIHYSKAQQRDHVPAQSIQVSPQNQALLQQRRVILSQGALARKEFMLRDRGNWPTITPPAAVGRQGSVGQMTGPHRRGPSVGVTEPTVEEEEDVSRGDALDFMTPREVSRSRYEQNHEWMEEVLENPYRTTSIVPPELGLGRKGELETLTNDFFNAPISTLDSSTTDDQTSRAGRLDPAKAEEFTRLANERIAAIQAELDKMKQAHQKRMEKLRQSSALNNAEKRLRAVHIDASRSKNTTNSSGSPVDAPDALDDIVKEIEGTLGKTVKEMKQVTCVSRGGFQPELAPHIPSSSSENRSMSNTSGSVAQQQAQPQPQPQVQSQTQPPQQQQQQQSQSQSQPQPPSQSVTQQQNQRSPVTTAAPPVQPTADTNTPAVDDHTMAQDDEMPDIVDDIDMTGLDDQPEMQADDTGDWVMVGDKDMTNVPSGQADQPGSSGDNQQHQAAGQANKPADTSMQDMQSNTQGQDLTSNPDQPISGDTPLDTGDFDLGHEFENTAGDALAGFDADDDLNLDDSAFGDAFPPQD